MNICKVKANLNIHKDHTALCITRQDKAILLQKNEASSLIW